MLTSKEIPISNFVYDVYLFALERFIHHVQYDQKNSKNICGSLHHNACYSKTESITIIRDYAERIFINFNLEVQSYHCGNRRLLSIEEYNVEIVDE